MGIIEMSRSVRYGVSFHRPMTKKFARKPVYRRICKRLYKRGEYNAIKYPLTSEYAMKKVEDHNTLVFSVERNATKKEVIKNVRKLYNVDIQKVNTLICPNGDKKAFVRLSSENDALDIANKIGLI